jgi:predicted dehydrogenase
MSPSPVRVGIIGLGFGRAHIAAFQALGCTVDSLCQRDLESARAVAQRYGVPSVFDRWERMLEEARPDVVVIATPPHLHRAIAAAALAGGAHVLCEKPLGMNVEEGLAMVDAARRAERVAMTSFNWRSPAAMQRFAALVRDGAVGRPFHITGRWMGARWAAEQAPATWRMDRAQAGLGSMGDMGVHLVDLVRWHFGEFARVTAHAGIAYPERGAPGTGRPADAEDYCAVLGELASGAQVTLSVSRVAHGMSQHELDVFGTRGALRYRMLREGPRWYRGELWQAGSDGQPFAPVRVPTGLPRSAGEGDPLEVLGKATIAPLGRRLLRAMRRRETPSPSFEDGLRAQAVLDAVADSLRQGGWVAVPPA